MLIPQHFYPFFWRHSPQWAMASSLTRFLDHTQLRTTLGRTPLDERSVRRRDLYQTTHNIHRQTPMPPVGFEPTISAGERQLGPVIYMLSVTSLLYVLNKFWCQLPEDGEIITPKYLVVMYKTLIINYVIH
jgi:hypothetical protein